MWADARGGASSVSDNVRLSDMLMLNVLDELMFARELMRCVSQSVLAPMRVRPGREAPLAPGLKEFQNWESHPPIN